MIREHVNHHINHMNIKKIKREKCQKIKKAPLIKVSRIYKIALIIQKEIRYRVQIKKIHLIMQLTMDRIIILKAIQILVVILTLENQENKKSQKTKSLKKLSAKNQFNLINLYKIIQIIKIRFLNIEHPNDSSSLTQIFINNIFTIQISFSHIHIIQYIIIIQLLIIFTFKNIQNQMSLIQQYAIQALLAESLALATRQEKQAQSSLFAKIDKIHTLLTLNIRQTFAQYSQQVLIKFAQVTVEIPKKISYSEEIIRLYFQRFKDPNQFYIRALLVKARLISIAGHQNKKKAQQMIEVLRQSIASINKALDIIAGPQDQSSGGKGSKPAQSGDSQLTNKQKYGFLIFNASNCLYKIIRFMLKTNWIKNFTDIIDRIYKLFQQLDQPDHNWRSRFTLILYQCLYDSDKKPDAFKILDTLWEKTKNKPCQFQDNLFRLRVHLTKENKALEAVIKKDIQGNNQKGWGPLQMLQKIKSGITPQNLIQKQLTSYLNSVSTAIILQNNDNSVSNLSPIVQQRLAETGRVALQFNLVQVADKVYKYINRVRQPSQKAMVLNQYNKSQLLIKKQGQQVDPKTGMKYNSIQLKLQQIQNRSIALKILQKVMIINKRLNDADLIYQGSILIWNLSLPFMTPSHRQNITKAFQIACNLLQQIDCTDHSLRSKLHLQLAKSYFQNESQFFRVQEHISKALNLDPSIPLNKLSNLIKVDPQDNPSLYQRPHQRYIQLLKQKCELKKNNFQRIMTDLDRIVMDLWNVIGQKSENTRIDILQKCLGTLVSIQQKQYDLQDAKKRVLVQQEIKIQQIKHRRDNLKQLKKKKLLAAQIAQLAFQWQINQVAQKACEFVISDRWDVNNAQQMILAQVKCSFFLAQIYIDYMINDNFEVAFLLPIKIEQDEQQQKVQITQIQKDQLLQRKKKITNLLSKGLSLADSIQQSWLIFNGAIYIWNNFLHVFKDPTKDSKLLPQIPILLKQYFESMKNSLKQSQKKQIISYDMENKLQVFANIGLIYARLMEASKQTDQVNKICQVMSNNQQLSPHTKKLINSIKSRVSNSKGGGSNPQKAVDPKNKNANQTGSTNNTDQILFDIVSQLQIIKNSVNKAETQTLIKKCFQTLENWKAKQNDQTQLELHAQLWAKLARLALNQSMFKVSLKSVQYSLSLLSPKTDLQTIPHNRLRWYSLSQYLYSQNLAKIVNPETQQPQNCERLLFAALDHAVEASHKGYKCKINSLVLDASKQVWNISSRLQESFSNRRLLIKPLYSTLSYLKQLKQKSETDLLLLLSQLFFKCCIENQQYKLGQSAADMLFQLIPKSFQKPLWEAKMIFMSKLNKNELQAISNMKQADASLQAKLYVKLARVATNNLQKQYASYNRAIQILKKQNSVQIVQVLIQYAEWQLRTGKERVSSVTANLILASDYLIDIQFGQEGDDDGNQMEQQKATVFSRSTRGKKSQYSNSASQKSKISKQKKTLQKKSQMSSSNKSKGSRMNRTARITKALKSKNTKSIFAQRQEQSNPQSLNCIHYERLFRIHSILAQICDNTEERIRYCLDAKQFLIKILQVSFKTLNTIDQNALKYANIIQDKKLSNNLSPNMQQQQQQQFIKKYKMPQNVEEWLKLTLSKQFLQKVKTYQDYNFMGVYLFDKAQLTFTYISQLITILESYCYHLQTIPLYFFLRFLAKQILNNSTLSITCDLRFVLTLKKCSFPKQIYQPIIQNISLSKIKLTQAQKKSYLSKTTSLRSSNIQQSKSFDNLLIQTIQSQNLKPNLVKPFSEKIYQIWIQLAIILIDFGQISKAKDFLKQALKHAKMLADIYNLCRCQLYLAKISYLQGQANQSLNTILIANKLCKSISLSEQVFKTTFTILLKLRKFEDLKRFMNSIREVTQKLIKQASTEDQNQLNHKREAPTHEQEMIDLYQLLNTVQIYKIKFTYKVAKSEPNINNLESFLQSLSSAQNSSNNAFNSVTTVLLQSQYQFFIQLALHIFITFQEGYFLNNISKSQKFITKSLRKIIKLLQKMEVQILSALKYAGMGINNYNIFYNRNSFINLHQKIRLIISRAYILDGIFKKKFHQIVEEQESKDQISRTPDCQPLKSYLEKLDLDIIKSLPHSIKQNQSFKNALSILISLQTKLNKDSYNYVIWGVQMSAAKRNCGQEISTNNHIEQFLRTHQQKIDNLILNRHGFNYSKRLYLQRLQNISQKMLNDPFQSLSKTQHYAYSQKVRSQLKQNIQKNNKLITYPRLLRKIFLTTNNNQIQNSITNLPLFSSLTKFPTFSQCIKLLPNNHMVLILQMSPDKSKIYFCSYSISKTQNKPTCIYKNQAISFKDLQQLEYLKKQINNIKNTLCRIPIDDHQIEKYYDVLQQKQKELFQIMKKIQMANLWWTKQIKSYLQNKKDSASQITQQKDTKKGAKESTAKGSKKGGKDQITSYQSPLLPSPSGIQSITILLDPYLYFIPFQCLQCFNSVPAISRDLSLFYLGRKLKQLNYKTELNNSNGWQADKTKFLSYDYKLEQNNMQSIITDLTKQAPSFKFEGIGSNRRIPSLGEFQKLLNQGTIFHFYGFPSFCNQFTLKNILNTIQINKIRLLILTDNLNFKKIHLNKFNRIEDGQVIKSEDQQLKLINILNLLNISIIKSRWSGKLQNTIQSIKKIYKILGEEIYTGAVLKKIQNTQFQNQLLYKIGWVYNGPPIIRI